MFLLILLPLFPGLYALDNGLTLTPPMGWMTWQRFRCIIDCTVYPRECIRHPHSISTNPHNKFYCENFKEFRRSNSFFGICDLPNFNKSSCNSKTTRVIEQLIREMADLMVSEGYLAAGYEYIVVDDCWMAKERDENHRLKPDPERFPSGIKALANYVQSLGLKFGIYEDYGTRTCAGYPGIIGHLETDAQTFADWEVDYLKLDGCYNNRSTMVEGYVEFGRLLNKTGRPIVYSCSWPAYEEPLGIKSDYKLLVETCNLWRNWDDIEDAWSNVTNILKWFSDNQDRISKYSGPGHWNDPDMLLIGNYALSDEQSKSQMAIWSIMAAPLLMSVDLRTIKAEHKEILLNADAIAINQDPLGIMGKLVYTTQKIDVWTKPIIPVINGENSLAIGFLSNRVDGYPHLVEVPLKGLGLSSSNGYHVKNIFEPTYNDVLNATHVFVRVKPSGTVFLKLVPRDNAAIFRV